PLTEYFRGGGMKSGVPKETVADERRVALTPDVAGRLGKSGLPVHVERAAGQAASFDDEAYRAAGATVVATAAEVFGQSDVVLKVQPPSSEEIALCREGVALVAVFQAIATARRLGAVVAAFEVRPVVKEQVQSLGAKFLEMEIGEHAEAAGGYAKQLSEETHRRELAFIAQQVKDADIVITTAAIPGQRAPVLITADAVRAMKPGAVIVDLAVETGGNCELTEAGREVVRNGVLLLGPLNLPSTLPQHASQMYARNTSSFLSQLIKDGALRLDFD